MLWKMGVRGGDVALELALDLVDVVLKAEGDGGEELPALCGGDLCPVL